MSSVFYFVSGHPGRGGVQHDKHGQEWPGCKSNIPLTSRQMKGKNEVGGGWVGWVDVFHLRSLPSPSRLVSHIKASHWAVRYEKETRPLPRALDVTPFFLPNNTRVTTEQALYTTFRRKRLVGVQRDHVA